MADADLELVTDNTQLVVKEITTAINRALEKVGIKAEGDVIGYMTNHNIVDTGRLRNSITHAVLNGEKSVIIGTNVEYAVYVHEGTHKMAGRPYLREPIINNQKDYADIIEGELKNS